MPADAERRYLALPTTSTLLRLSRREDEDADADTEAHTGDPAREATDGPCRYFVVNREAASDKLQAYVRSLPVELFASDGIRYVYRLAR